MAFSIGSLLGIVGTAAGTYVGGPAGGAIGGQLGGLAGEAIDPREVEDNSPAAVKPVTVPQPQAAPQAMPLGDAPPPQPAPTAPQPQYSSPSVFQTQNALTPPQETNNDILGELLI